ncbi:MAG: YnbE family lipoprotein [Gammaproteobacteria bacterium]|nr:YnbE family lipoprotein [Gammaproteobacteria bacterium]MBU2059913.1 YnbE family lipoprotein [Gammaproteobacteria bacterium]MBU2175832.1 YnbE family lipoprotein [Gammaproteobacteria bacterium]MBU2247655.1 YnbE family lipoprotein [Gammaproteobacteria bacterium]MBU2346486.1 YnbE family lipoprotein [Gammaproteobacteria bacterium]
MRYQQDRQFSQPQAASQGRAPGGAVSLCLALLLSAACTPTVQVAMPNEPININLNVKIQHEILIKVDKELDELISDSSGLF